MDDAQLTTMDQGNGRAPEPRRRRTRRTATELRELILDAAREEFRYAGYEAATTKAISLRAGVSESLLFRYFGPKSGLLEAAAIAPFNAMIERFQSRYYSGNLSVDGERSWAFIHDLTEYLRENRLLLARLMYPEPGGKRSAMSEARGLDGYFERASSMLGKLQSSLGRPADPHLELSVRLAFGMVLGSVLFSEWLFDEGQSERAVDDALAENLARMLQTHLA
jgi:AcrR family transcriptional regulator